MLFDELVILLKGVGLGVAGIDHEWSQVCPLTPLVRFYILFCSLSQTYLLHPKLRIEVRLTESLLSPAAIAQHIELAESRKSAPNLDRMHIQDQFSVKIEDANGSFSTHQIAFVYSVLLNTINGTDAGRLVHKFANIDVLLGKIPAELEAYECLTDLCGKLEQFTYSHGNTIHGKITSANLSGLEVKKLHCEENANTVNTASIVSTKVPEFLKRGG